MTFIAKNFQDAPVRGVKRFTRQKSERTLKELEHSLSQEALLRKTNVRLLCAMLESSSSMGAVLELRDHTATGLRGK